MTITKWLELHPFTLSLLFYIRVGCPLFWKTISAIFHFPFYESRPVFFLSLSVVCVLLLFFALFLLLHSMLFSTLYFSRMSLFFILCEIYKNRRNSFFMVDLDLVYIVYVATLSSFPSHLILAYY